MKRYLIYSDAEGLWWSNDDGWVDQETATVFYNDEPNYLKLPLGGRWVLLDPESAGAAHEGPIAIHKSKKGAR